MVLHIFKCPKDGINNGVSSVVSFFLFSIIFEEIYWIGILSGKRVYGSILTRGFASLFFSILSSHSCTSVSQVFWLNLLILLFFAVFCFLRVLQVYFTILLLKLLFWFFFPWHFKFGFILFTYLLPFLSSHFFFPSFFSLSALVSHVGGFSWMSVVLWLFVCFAERHPAPEDWLEAVYEWLNLTNQGTFTVSYKDRDPAIFLRFTSVSIYRYFLFSWFSLENSPLISCLEA